MGSASVSILFFEVTVSFDETFGDPPERARIEPVNLWDPLLAALRDLRNWSATLPTGTARGVSTAADGEQPARVRLDPMSVLAVRQKVMPLDRRITRLGESPIEGPTRIRVGAVRVGCDALGVGGANVQHEALNEPFAAAQYESLDDAQRLSRPSFEPMAAGAQAQGRALATERPVVHRPRLETIRVGRDPSVAQVLQRMHAQMAQVDSASVAALRIGGAERYAPGFGAVPMMTLAPEQWALASTHDLRALTGSTGGTWGAVARGGAHARRRGRVAGGSVPRGEAMTEPGVEAEETFVPWLRRGLGVGIGRAGATAEGGRASLRVVVELERRVEPPGAAPRNDTERAVVTLPMFGPADVTGLDPRAVLRVWPQPEMGDAESEFLPLVEFAEPDLPWRYTPAGAVEGRLRPWLCLLALADGEFTLLPSGQGRSRTEVQINAGVVLPDLRQAWAWAHVHVTEAIPGNPTPADLISAAIFAVHERAPSRVVARLLCARRLQARKRYTVVAVPTFDAAGTGDAWSGTRTTAQLTLPVYHHWSFGTGLEGDFRTLAMRLTMCTDMPATVGKRSVDLRGAAPRLHAFRSGGTVDTLALGAALEPVRESTEPEAPPPVELVGADPPARSLAELLNALAPSILQTDATPLVGPPAYGSWYLRWQRFPVEPLTPRAPWMSALNLDVAHRIAAGVGTRIVQEQQQALMASAWAQLGSLRRIDEERRFSQVSREAGRRIYRRDVTPMSTESLLRFTAPMHGRVMMGPMTVRAAFEKSPIDPAVLSATWRRVARPAAPWGAGRSATR